MANPDVSRLKTLTRRPRETWQGGLVRLPLWVTPPGEAPFRPWAGAWVSLATGKVHVGEGVVPSAREPEQALRSLVEFAGNARDAGYLPERLEVTGPGVAPLLGPVLQELGVTVIERDRLAGLQGFLSTMAREVGGERDVPGALEGPGVTFAMLATFAEGARLFHEAAPWKHLTDEDLIRVEEPGDLPDVRHLLVMGAGGREFGLLLFSSAELHEELLSDEPGTSALDGTHYSVFFGGPEAMPLEDSALFEDHRLAVAGPRAWPWAAHVASGRRIRRPGAKIMVRLDLLLRALAATTEQEIDSGRWTRIIPTADGPRRVTLALPWLLGERPKKRAVTFDRREMERVHLEISRLLSSQQPRDAEEAQRMIQERFMGQPLDQIPSTAVTPIERAQDLCHRAFSERGRLKVRMAREALRLSPDCVDAYALLAEHTGDPQQELRLYAEAVAAGERTLGARLENPDGSFWDDVTTRPFMRALEGLASIENRLGMTTEAIGRYQRLLRLNPNDNQGVRWPLAGLLLETGDDEALDGLLRQYEDDDAPVMAYAKVLRTFRAHGDGALSRRALREAVESNPHVVDILTESVPAPVAGSFAPGSPEEAAYCVEILERAWEQIPGALEWLEQRQG